MVRFSFVIPAFNEAAYIGGCLDSLKAQTVKNFEVIVVDSGTDNTAKIARRYGCRVFKQERRGPAEARNLGASKARGEVLIFADADVRFHPDFVERIGKKFDSKKTLGGAICRLRAYDCQTRCEALGYSLINSMAKLLIKSRLMVTSGSCFIFTKTAFQRAGGFNPALCTNEDHDLANRVGKFSRFMAFGDIEVLTSARRIKRWGFFKAAKINTKSALLYLMAKKPLPDYWQ